MALKVVGAGLGRTGTHSLKNGLEILLGAPCYHMVEVFEHPEDNAVWKAAAEGKPVDWDNLFDGYAAAVDWPTCGLWPEIAAYYPGALILYSRRNPESWWESASSTIFRMPPPKEGEEPSDWFKMITAVFGRHFTIEIYNKEACLAAFARHENTVLSKAPKDRLLVWEASEGWEPICKALDLPVPKEPFPKVNTKEQFLAHVSNHVPGAE